MQDLATLPPELRDPLLGALQELLQDAWALQELEDTARGSTARPGLGAGVQDGEGWARGMRGRTGHAMGLGSTQPQKARGDWVLPRTSCRIRTSLSVCSLKPKQGPWFRIAGNEPRLVPASLASQRAGDPERGDGGLGGRVRGQRGTHSCLSRLLLAALLQLEQALDAGVLGQLGGPGASS